MHKPAQAHMQRQLTAGFKQCRSTSVTHEQPRTWKMYFDTSISDTVAAPVKLATSAITCTAEHQHIRARRTHFV
jgi:hypothetical protein